MDEFEGMEIDEWEVLHTKLAGYDNSVIKLIWDAKKNYNPNESYAIGISMDEFFQEVFAEMNKRNLIN